MTKGVDMGTAFWLVAFLGALALVKDAARGALRDVLARVPGEIVRVPRALDEHDLRVEQLNESGSRWIVARKLELDRQSRAVTNEANARGLLFSGVHINLRQIAIEDASQELHDQVVAAEQEYRVLEIQERTWHRVWARVLRRAQRPELDMRVRAVEALMAWRAAHEGWAPSAGSAARGWRPNALLDTPATTG